jgi:hypothetical protein
MSAQIVFNNGKTHKMYFEVEKKFSEYLAKDMSPFLAAMLPISMLTKEPIEVEGSVSKKFFDQTTDIMNIAQSWNEGLSPISITIKDVKKDTKKLQHGGCFFSGGADSFYTFLTNKKSIDTLIFVHGFDIKISDTDVYAMVEKNIEKIADNEKVDLVKVKTNIREIYNQYIDWDLAHGFAVGSVALFLRNGFTSIYVSCGLAVKNEGHFSMTPEIDKLYSSEYMNIVHFGCNAPKLLKLEELSKSALAMDTLRVCWVNRKQAYNCCSCEKCMRNMLGLYLCDGLGKSKTFDKKINLERLKKIRVNSKEIKYFKIILQAFDKKGDTSEVRNALAEFITNNSSPGILRKTITASRDWVRKIDGKYNQNRLYWFMSRKGMI